jgi:hypothetical protein
MAARKVVRQSQNVPLQKLVTEYRNAKEFAAQAAARETQLKEMLRERVVAEGTPDDNGSLWLDVEGVDGLSAVKNERRVSALFDAEAAQEWCEEHDIDCTETVVQWSQDKFWALVFEKKIPKKTANGFKKEKESWALKLQ